MHKRLIGALAATGALVGASLVVVVAGPAAATTISVSNETEYRNALTTLSTDASGPHTINITADITLSGGTDPTYAGTPQSLTLAGNGHTIDANGTSRVLFFSTGGSGAVLTVQDLTVTGGKSTGGGAIVATSTSAGAPVTLTNSTVSGNTATVSNGGGVLAGAVTVTNSTVSGNTAAGGSGGGIAATLTFTGQPVTLTNSTVSGNTSSGNGGGVSAVGPVTITNSTITGNTATGGGSVGGGVSTDGGVTLVYSTVVQNTAMNAVNVSGSPLTSFGSVVALPAGGGANCTASVTTNSNGFNFADDTSCKFTASTDHQNAGDPGLGALANNGGPTQTRLPQAGSPLIDAIPNASCQADGASGITTDQRGLPRPEVPGGLCDVGAVEVQPPSPPGPTPGPTPAPPVQAVVRFTG